VCLFLLTIPFFSFSNFITTEKAKVTASIPFRFENFDPSIEKIDYSYVNTIDKYYTNDGINEIPQKYADFVNKIGTDIKFKTRKKFILRSTGKSIKNSTALISFKNMFLPQVAGNFNSSVKTNIDKPFIDFKNRVVKYDNLSFTVNLKSGFEIVSKTELELIARFKVKKEYPIGSYLVTPTFIFDVVLDMRSSAKFLTELSGGITFNLKNVIIRIPDFTQSNSPFDFSSPDKMISKMEVPKFDINSAFSIVDGVKKQMAQLSGADNVAKEAANVINKSVKDMKNDVVTFDRFNYSFNSEFKSSLENITKQTQISIRPQLRVELMPLVAKEFQEFHGKRPGTFYRKLKNEGRKLLTLPENLMRLKTIVGIKFKLPLLTSVINSSELKVSTNEGEFSVDEYSKSPYLRGFNTDINLGVELYPHIDDDYCISFSVLNYKLASFKVFDKLEVYSFNGNHLFYPTAIKTGEYWIKDFKHKEKEFVKFLVAVAKNSHPVHKAIIQSITGEILKAIEDPEQYVKDKAEEAKVYATSAKDMAQEKVTNTFEAIKKGPSIDMASSAFQNGVKVGNLNNFNFKDSKVILQNPLNWFKDDKLGFVLNGIKQPVFGVIVQGKDMKFENITRNVGESIIKGDYQIAQGIVSNMKSAVYYVWKSVKKLWSWVTKKKKKKRYKKVYKYGIKATKGGMVRVQVKRPNADNHFVFTSSNDGTENRFNLVEQDNFCAHMVDAVAMPYWGYRFTGWYSPWEFKRFEGWNGSDVRMTTWGCGNGYINDNVIHMWPNSMGTNQFAQNDWRRLRYIACFERNVKNIKFKTLVNNRTSGIHPGFITISGSNKRVYSDDVVAFQLKNQNGALKKWGGLGMINKFNDNYLNYRVHAHSLIDRGFKFSHWTFNIKKFKPKFVKKGFVNKIVKEEYFVRGKSFNNYFDIDAGALQEGETIEAIYDEVVNLKLNKDVNDKVTLTFGEKRFEPNTLLNKSFIEKKKLLQNNNGYLLNITYPKGKKVVVRYRINNLKFNDALKYENIKAKVNNEIITKELNPSSPDNLNYLNHSEKMFIENYNSECIYYNEFTKTLTLGNNLLNIPVGAYNIDISIVNDDINYIRFRPSSYKYNTGYIKNLPDFNLSTFVAEQKPFLDNKLNLYYIQSKEEFAKNKSFEFIPSIGYKFKEWKHLRTHENYKNGNVLNDHYYSFTQDIYSSMKYCSNEYPDYKNAVMIPIVESAKLIINIPERDEDIFSPIHFTWVDKNHLYDNFRGTEFVYNKTQFSDDKLVIRAPKANDGRKFLRWEANHKYCNDMNSEECVIDIHNPAITNNSDQEITLTPIYTEIPTIKNNIQEFELDEFDLEEKELVIKDTAKLLVSPNPTSNGYFRINELEEVSEHLFPLQMNIVDIRTSKLIYCKKIIDRSELLNEKYISNMGLYRIIIHSEPKNKIIFNSSLYVIN
jgi:hypothetical protein